VYKRTTRPEGLGRVVATGGNRISGAAAPALHFASAALIFGPLEIHAPATRGDGTGSMALLMIEFGHGCRVPPRAAVVYVSMTRNSSVKLQLTLLS